MSGAEYPLPEYLPHVLSPLSTHPLKGPGTRDTKPPEMTWDQRYPRGQQNDWQTPLKTLPSATSVLGSKYLYTFLWVWQVFLLVLKFNKMRTVSGSTVTFGLRWTMFIDGHVGHTSFAKIFLAKRSVINQIPLRLFIPVILVLEHTCCIYRPGEVRLFLPWVEFPLATSFSSSDINNNRTSKHTQHSKYVLTVKRDCLVFIFILFFRSKNYGQTMCT